MTTIQEKLLPIDNLVLETSKQGRREAAALSDHLKKLPEKRWLNRSFCSEWTIRDVAEHLTAMGLLMRDGANATLQGKPLSAITPEAIQKYEAALGDLNRVELADHLTEVTNDFYDLLERATPEQLERKVQSPFGELVLANLGSFRLSELSLHSWDVRVVDDLTAKVSRESLPLLFPGLIAALPALAHRATAKELSSVTYQFEINGPVKGPVALSLEHGKIKTLSDYADKPDVTVKLESDAFLRLTWGRLNLDWMIRDGWVKIEGDKAKALRLNQLFQGV